MKTLKLILIGVALLSCTRLFSQNVEVINNTALSGSVRFNFVPPSPPAVCNTNPGVPFLANVGGTNSTSCSGLTFVSVEITFYDPNFPCQPNPQPVIILDPGTLTGSYTDCPPAAVPPSTPPPPTTYFFSLTQVGADWLVTIN